MSTCLCTRALVCLEMELEEKESEHTLPFTCFPVFNSAHPWPGMVNADWPLLRRATALPLPVSLSRCLLAPPGPLLGSPPPTSTPSPLPCPSLSLLGAPPCPAHLFCGTFVPCSSASLGFSVPCSVGHWLRAGWSARLSCLAGGTLLAPLCPSDVADQHLPFSGSGWVGN